MQTRTFLGCLALFTTVLVNAQTGKYFTATATKCKSPKVFIDHRIQQHCGTEFTADWSGTCKDGFAEGNGILTIVSKKYSRYFTMVYEGTLLKGKKEGKGSLSVYGIYSILPPNYSYSGSFKNDEFNGYGEFTADYPYPVRNEDVGKGVSLEELGLDLPLWRSDLFFYEYNGNFINGKIADTENGTGKTKWMRWLAEKVEYKGAIKNGRPSGKGTATESTIAVYANAAAYASISGNFVNGRVNGYGKQVGSYFQYEGDFVNGIREGKGKMTVYEYNGAWQVMQDNTLPEGKHAAYILDGNFSQGEANGFFTIYFQNSAAYKYTGPMKSGVIEGTGEIEYIDGSKFRGNFRSNRREGEGSVTFADGDKFSGEYKDDMPVRGTMYYSNGAKYEGEMSTRKEKKNNKTVNIYIKQGKGTITYSDGTKKEVTCVNDDCN